MPNEIKPATGKVSRQSIFAPILAGATLRERLVGCLGALIGIAATGLICKLVLGSNSSLPLIVAPLGASAVLLFAIPTSPLAQPWSIIGGNTISALVGVIVARIVPDQLLAIGFGVSLAILAMSFARCLHPPGGAAALTAIIGGPAVTNAGFLFPFVPVTLNCVLLVGLGFLFHKMSGRSYPHSQLPTAVPRQTTDLQAERTEFRSEDIEQALDSLKETFDISVEDIDKLLREVEYQATLRSHGKITCADMMSSEVVTVTTREGLDRARQLLLHLNVRILPVVDDENRVVGTIGLREMVNGNGSVSSCMSPAITFSAATPAIALVASFTNRKSQAAVIVEPDGKIVGIVTRTDLIETLIKLLPIAA